MPANILLIEDDAAHRHLVGYLLEHAGHTVRSLVNGTDALKLCREERPDMIISDLQLKGAASGYLVAREIREHPDLRSIPLVCISSTYEMLDVERAKAAGFNIFIPKPILAECFVPQIEFYLPAEKRCWIPAQRI